MVNDRVVCYELSSTIINSIITFPMFSTTNLSYIIKKQRDGEGNKHATSSLSRVLLQERTLLYCQDH